MFISIKVMRTALTRYKWARYLHELPMKFETNGKVNEKRENLIRRISSLEAQQKVALAKKSNGVKEPVDIQKQLDKLREQLRSL